MLHLRQLLQEISQQPLIRAKVKEIVTEIAVISTMPTEVGAQVLTPFHKHGAVKRIRDKPAQAILLDFPDQFLQMVAAEKEGLVKVCSQPACDEEETLIGMPPVNDVRNHVECAGCRRGASTPPERLPGGPLHRAVLDQCRARQ